MKLPVAGAHQCIEYYNIIGIPTTTCSTEYSTRVRTVVLYLSTGIAIPILSIAIPVYNICHIYCNSIAIGTIYAIWP